MSEPEGLSHLSPSGKARMVDISSKEATSREARAEAFVRVGPEVLDLLRANDLEKGDALAVSKIAGIMAAKRTAELIPLCHPLSLTDVDVVLEVETAGVRIRSRVKTTDRTGVEMEALVAASVAALTLYDMCKSAQRDISIETIQLVAKSGGKSGDWERTRDG